MRDGKMIWLHIKGNVRETFWQRSSEWACAFMVLLWGWRLGYLPGLFDGNAAFVRFSQVASQDVWAWGAIICGSARILILAINGAWRRSYHARGIAAFLCCGFWLQVAVSFYLSGSASTSLAIYPVLVVLETLHVLRAAVEARAADNLHNAAHDRASHGGTI
jgi:hypothetical protein